MVATDVDYVDLGDVKRIEVEVRDSAGALANATAVTLTITLPDGTTTSPAVSNPSTGLYRVDYSPAVEGRHTWRMVATGSNASAHTDVFDVRAAASPALVSLLAAKTHLNIPAATTTHDQELRGWIDAATTIVETHPVYGIGPVLPRTVVEDHDGGRAVVYLDQVPVISLTSVAPVRTGGTTVNVADLDVNTKTGKLQYLTGITFPHGPYRFTYRVGYAITTANVRSAALIIIKGLWETQRGASMLPMQLEDVAETPGMGLYMWRAKLLLNASPRIPGVA